MQALSANGYVHLYANIVTSSVRFFLDSKGMQTLMPRRIESPGVQDLTSWDTSLSSVWKVGCGGLKQSRKLHVGQAREKSLARYLKRGRDHVDSCAGMPTIIGHSEPPSYAASSKTTYSGHYASSLPLTIETAMVVSDLPPGMHHLSVSCDGQNFGAPRRQRSLMVHKLAHASAIQDGVDAEQTCNGGACIIISSTDGKDHVTQEFELDLVQHRTLFELANIQVQAMLGPYAAFALVGFVAMLAEGRNAVLRLLRLLMSWINGSSWANGFAQAYC